ncbi:unnamed protein product [Cylicocyclus nassatus]|uniref:PRORP domain-containing protein n=1 Tax=Cylicocyclus nassatus TaxID=53992 RepID=A0AA36LZ30_CYLNA|nr:unnamed protein product [Cylicocyclus nassatus]
MSEEGKLRALRKDRQICHQARDKFLDCLDKSLDSGKNEVEARKDCRIQLQAFEDACPASHLLSRVLILQIKMLLAMKRTTHEGLRLSFCVRNLSKAAKKSSKRSKPVLESSCTSVPDVGPVEQSRLTKSSAELKKPLPVPFDNVKIKPIPSRMKTDLTSSRKHWTLLQLVKPDVIESHPLLKFVDLSDPPNVAEIPEHITLHRILSSLRLCQKFDFGYELVRARLSKLPPPAVLEAARLVAEGEMHRRCIAKAQFKEQIQDASSLASELLDRAKQLRLPPSMSLAIRALLTCVTSPKQAVAEFFVDAFAQVIYRREVHSHLACAALDANQWSQFSLIMDSCPLSPHYSPLLIFHIVEYLLRNSENRKKVIDWYMNALSREQLPLTPLQWSEYASLLIEMCGSKADPVLATKQGALTSPTGQTLPFSVPHEKDIDEGDFQCLKEDMNTLLNDLSKDSGSVTKKEVSALRQKIRSWSKSNEKAVVIDSLNVFHGTLRGLEPLIDLTNRLSKEYENVILVTRPFLFEKLKSVRWRGNVRMFSCATLSEDDLLVLLAAMEWGRNAYVLSNDRFAAHEERARCTGQLSLHDWMRRRMLRFNRHDWQYDQLPLYGEYVQHVAPATYFVPVVEETPGISKRSSYIVSY